MIAAVLLDDALDLRLVVLQRLVAPPLAQVPVLVVSPACKPIRPPKSGYVSFKKNLG